MKTKPESLEQIKKKARTSILEKLNHKKEKLRSERLCKIIWKLLKNMIWNFKTLVAFS